MDVHTSELISFRRCRLRWDWGGYTRQNYAAKAPPDALWFGSAFHFALEAFHAYQKKGFDLASEWFVAFCQRWPAADRPMDWETLVDLGIGMLQHYQNSWLDTRGGVYDIFYVKGKPQVEVSWSVPLTKEHNLKGRFDAVVQDSEGRLWVLDYKTTSRFNTSKLENDYQVTSYVFAATQLYGTQVEGMLYQQHRKAVPEQPEELKRGGLSKKKSQSCTFAQYRKALIAYYGGENEVPWEEYQAILAELGANDTPDADPFIRRDLVYRSEEALRLFKHEVLLQLEDMQSAYIYSNPTRDCSWCPFHGACQVRNDGGDFGDVLEAEFTKRETDKPGRSDEIRDELLKGAKPKRPRKRRKS